MTRLGFKPENNSIHSNAPLPSGIGQELERRYKKDNNEIVHLHWLGDNTLSIEELGNINTVADESTIPPDLTADQFEGNLEMAAPEEGTFDGPLEQIDEVTQEIGPNETSLEGSPEQGFNQQSDAIENELIEENGPLEESATGAPLQPDLSELDNNNDENFLLQAENTPPSVPPSEAVSYTHLTLPTNREV